MRHSRVTLEASSWSVVGGRGRPYRNMGTNMVRHFLAASVAVIFVASASCVQAYEDTLSMLSDVANALSPDGGNEGWQRYRSFVSGIYEGHMISASLYKQAQLTCPSPETTRQELAEAVLAHLTTLSPTDEMAEIPARTTVFVGLVRAFPCD